VKIYEEWLKPFTKLDKERQGITLGNLGNAYQSLGQYDKAINFPAVMR